MARMDTDDSSIQGKATAKDAKLREGLAGGGPTNNP